MPNFVLLATAWGPKHGGINAFNMDFAIGLANHLGGQGKVFCAAFSPTLEDIADAQKKCVRLLEIDRPVDSPAYDSSWAWNVWCKFQEKCPGERIDWWIGHDVTTGHAAVEGPDVAKHGKSALIMHMNYADYQAYKAGVGERAHRKVLEQRKLFPKAARWFANGPLLASALKEIVGPSVSMLIPGFADVPVKSSSHRLNVITFGRMDRESDRVKQGALAVAGFASAVKQAWLNAGSPEKLKDNPRMWVVGIKEPGGDEERTLIHLASEKADREVNLIALEFDENRAQLFDELSRANISLMLSWHEGFGLTGWEAIAGQVPLTISRQSGLWQLLSETFEGNIPAGYVRTINVRGQSGSDDAANYHPVDESTVRDAIIDCTANLEEARANAAKLKRLLQEKLICTWENTAKQFLDGLGIEVSATTPETPETASVAAIQLPGNAPIGTGVQGIGDEIKPKISDIHRDVPEVRDTVGSGGEAHQRSIETPRSFEAARGKAEQLYDTGQPAEAAQVFVDALRLEDQLERERQEDHKQLRLRYIAAAVDKVRQLAENVHRGDPEAQYTYTRHRAVEYYRDWENSGRELGAHYCV